MGEVCVVFLVPCYGRKKDNTLGDFHCGMQSCEQPVLSWTQEELVQTTRNTIHAEACGIIN